MISPTLTSLLSQRRQFGLNCKKNIALTIAYKIVALFTENYPSHPQPPSSSSRKAKTKMTSVVST